MTLRSPAPQAGASANSATPARLSIMQPLDSVSRVTSQVETRCREMGSHDSKRRHPLVLRAGCVLWKSHCWLLHDSAVEPFGRQVTWHIVKPEPTPGTFDLSKVFRLIHQLVGASPRITGVLIHDAASVHQPADTNDHHGDSLEHTPSPAWTHRIPKSTYANVRSPIGYTHAHPSRPYYRHNW